MSPILETERYFGQGHSETLQRIGDFPDESGIYPTNDGGAVEIDMSGVRGSDSKESSTVVVTLPANNGERHTVYIAKRGVNKGIGYAQTGFGQRLKVILNNR